MSDIDTTKAIADAQYEQNKREYEAGVAHRRKIVNDTLNAGGDPWVGWGRRGEVTRRAHELLTRYTDEQAMLKNMKAK